MIYISYKTACRDCYQTDGMTRMYSLQNAIQEEYLQRTEYSIMIMVEKWRLEDHRLCPFCGSKNEEVMDLEINNHALYDFNRLAESYGDFLFALNIDKTNSELELRVGGSRKLNPSFLSEAIALLFSTLKERPESLFQGKLNGTFFICITSRSMASVQRLKHAGITKAEIINKIMSYQTI